MILIFIFNVVINIVSSNYQNNKNTLKHRALHFPEVVNQQIHYFTPYICTCKGSIVQEGDSIACRGDITMCFYYYCFIERWFHNHFQHSHARGLQI